MKLLLAVGVGGALGAVARHLFVRAASGMGLLGLPWGTLGVNVLGSLAAGAFYSLLVERWAAGMEWRALLMTGFLGGFTTFSAFSLESVRLIESGRAGVAALNIGANLLLCLAACMLGLALVRRLA
ncbi:MAG TPA: CrcB family protein [Solimonas sp.]|nr:CrcB family protein [Solimonas sp.]